MQNRAHYPRALAAESALSSSTRQSCSVCGGAGSRRSLITGALRTKNAAGKGQTWTGRHTHDCRCLLSTIQVPWGRGRHCNTGLHSARLGCTASGKPYKAAAVSQPRRPPLEEPGAHSPCLASDASKCSPHPRLRNRQPGRKPRNNSPPFGYPELKYGGKGATVHYPCPSLVSSGE